MCVHSSMCVYVCERGCVYVCVLCFAGRPVCMCMYVCHVIRGELYSVTKATNTIASK